MGSRRSASALRPQEAEEAERLPSFQSFTPDFAHIRRRYLDAIPLAGAVLALEQGALRLVDCNDNFAQADQLPGVPPILERSGFNATVLEFLKGDDALLDFDWSDGGPITGRQYSVRLARLAPVFGDERRCLLTLLDRTAERTAEKNLRLEMSSDALTGLPNRAGFAEHLEAATGETGWAGRGYAVLIVDLMRFSRINDSIGSLAGDELLTTVARRIMSALRAGDVIARTGGDEFGLLIRIADGAEEALAVASRIHAVLATPCRLSDLELRIDIAIGCALSEPSCDEDEIVRRAQFAAKQAKESGGSEVYQPRAFNLARRQFTMETALRRALEENRLRLAFQPLIDLATGAVSGFEALARWQDEGVEISPAAFIPVAEESGLILPLGRWALDAALDALKAWDAQHGAIVPVSIAVNVSPIQIAREALGTVGAALKAKDIDASRLTLELTESAIIASPDRAVQAMDGLKALGVTLALDDFGTGYSNLAHLQRLPIDVLKIDQSFVTNMLGNRDKVAIVRAVLSLAEALGLKTTAEGVETLELSQTLAALGCTRAQGYYYAPPLDLDAAFQFWSRSNSAAT